MQPPLIDDDQPEFLRSYIDNLKAIAAAKALEAKRQRNSNEIKRQREPLYKQIINWWENLPVKLRNRHYQINEIAAQCHGKYRDRPALRDVAAILRSLGWTEYRDWTNDGRNRRMWKRL